MLDAPAALPVLGLPGDLVFIDQMAHNSLRVAARSLDEHVRVETAPHNRIDLLEDRINDDAGAHQRVRTWPTACTAYVVTGSQSMS